MSDTLRTDAEVKRIENDEKKYEDRYDTYIAIINFARQLERELNEAKRELENKSREAKDYRDAYEMEFRNLKSVSSERDKLKEIALELADRLKLAFDVYGDGPYGIGIYSTLTKAREMGLIK